MLFLHDLVGMPGEYIGLHDQILVEPLVGPIRHLLRKAGEQGSAILRDPG